MSEWRETNRAWWDERVPIHVGSELLRRRGVPGRRLDAARLRDRGGRRRRRPHARPPAVPLRPRHALVGPPRRARHRARLLRPRRSRRRAPWPTARAARRRLRPGRPLRRRRRRSAAAASTSSTPGCGALNWLPDIERWAQVDGRPRRPRRALLPLRVPPLRARVRRRRPHRRPPVLPRPRPLRLGRGRAPTPTPDARTEHNRTIEWSHPLGAVVSALARAGPADRVAPRAGADAVRDRLAVPRARRASGSSGCPTAPRRSR